MSEHIHHQSFPVTRMFEDQEYACICQRKFYEDHIKVLEDKVKFLEGLCDRNDNLRDDLESKLASLKAEKKEQHGFAREYSRKLSESQSRETALRCALERAEKALFKYSEHRAGCKENSKFETCSCELDSEKLLITKALSQSPRSPSPILEAIGKAVKALKAGCDKTIPDDDNEDCRMGMCACPYKNIDKALAILRNLGGKA